MAAEIERHNLGLAPHQIIIRPLVTEKGMHKAESQQRLCLRGQSAGRQGRHPPCGRRAVRRQGDGRPHAESQGQAPPHQDADERHQSLEEGDRHLGQGRSDQLLLKQSSFSRTGADCEAKTALQKRDYHGHSTLQSDFSRPPRGDRERFRRADARRKAGKEPAASQAAHGRPQQPGQDHRPLPWRRTQARLPHHRLPPRQGRRAGQGRLDPVRSQPHGPHRLAALCRRREALHPGPRRA